MAEAMDTLQATFSRASVKAELCNQLHSFQQNGHFCDVSILVHGHNIPAHRAVLAASSQYFRRMFEGGFIESSEAVINLSESISSVDTLKTALKFIYTGELELNSDTLSDILGASSLLMLEHLIEFCALFMVKHLEPSNCLRTWALADVFNLRDVCDLCQTMARCRFRDMIQYQQDIVDLPGSFLMNMVKKGVMDFLDAAEVGALLLRWFERDPKERFFACKEVIKLVEQQQRLSSFIASRYGSKSNIIETIDEMKLYLNMLSQFKEPTKGNEILKVVASKCSQAVLSGGPAGSFTYSLYLYSPQRDRWYVKDVTMPDDNTYAFMGATKESLVFQKKSDGIVIGVCSGCGVEWIQGSTDAAPDVDVAYHIWNGTLVMIRGYSGVSTEYITVFCFDFTRRSWKIIGKTCSIDIDTSRMNIGNSQINSYSVKDYLYVFVTCKDANITLLKLKHGCKDWQLLKLHQLPQLKGPPLRKYDEFEVTTNNDQIMLKIGNNILVGSLDNDLCNEFSKYTAEPMECWPASAPPKAWHSSENSGFQVLRVDSDMVAPMGTTGLHSQGYVFMEVVGEYLTKCWRGMGDPVEPDSFVWLEVTPMPNETLHSLSACEIHCAILQYFQRADFRQRKDTGTT